MRKTLFVKLFTCFFENVYHKCVQKMESRLHRFQKSVCPTIHPTINFPLTDFVNDKLLTDYKHTSHRMQKTARQATSGLLIHEFLIL